MGAAVKTEGKVINRVYGIRKNNKKDDNDADQSDISSPVKWFFLHKFQPF